MVSYGQQRSQRHLIWPMPPVHWWWQWQYQELAFKGGFLAPGPAPTGPCQASWLPLPSYWGSRLQVPKVISVTLWADVFKKNSQFFSSWLKSINSENFLFLQISTPSVCFETITGTSTEFSLKLGQRVKVKEKLVLAGAAEVQCLEDLCSIPLFLRGSYPLYWCCVLRLLCHGSVTLV